MGRRLPHAAYVRRHLRKKLAEYLRRTRGEMTFVEFERRIGVSASSLQRLEMCQQNITIDTLEHLLSRLKCRMSDIFRE